MRRRSLICALLVLPLLGLGCKEPSYNNEKPTNWRGVIQDAPKTPTRTPTPTPNVVRKGFDNERPTAPEVFLLRQALSNLASASSFRATLTLPPGEGGTQPVTGELLFDRNRGFRGTIRLSPQLSSEVLVISEEVYFRANTSTWENITNQPEGERLKAFFSVAFPEKTDSPKKRVSDKATILDVSDDSSKNCRRYTYSEIVPGGEVEKTVLCVKDNLPIYLQNEYAEGTTEVVYSSINERIDIGDLR